MIHSLAAVVIFLLVSNLPPIKPVTVLGMKLLGIIAGAMYGWCSIGPVIPSLAAVVVFGFIGYMPLTDVLMGLFGNYIVVIIIGLMLLSGIVVHTGLARVLAERIICSKIANGRPWVLTLLILIAVTIPSMFITAIPSIIVVYDIVTGIFAIVGFKKGEKWPEVIMISIVGAAVFGMGCMPFGMGAQADYGVLRILDPDAYVPSLAYIASSMTMVVFFIVSMWCLIRFVFKPDVSKLLAYKVSHRPPPFTKDQKRAMGLMIAFVFLVLLPEIIPGGNPVQEFLAGFGAMGFAFLIVLAAFLIHNKDGSPFITVKQAADSGIHWPIILMTGSVYLIFSAVIDPRFGISDFLAQTLQPVVSGFGPFGFFAALTLLVLVLTNLFNAVVAGCIIIPILFTVTGDAGLNTLAYMSFLTRTAQYSMLLPASSAMAVIMYSHEGGWMRRTAIIKYSAVFCVLYYLVILVTGYPTLSYFN
jgi:sodium-dependent dicarboxylate transporter 2/3/5